MPITHVNPDGMHRNPAFSWAVRVPAGHDTIYIGGQNGVGPDGTVVKELRRVKPDTHADDVLAALPS